MTKQEFLSSKDPLVLIVGIDLGTGHAINDVFPAEQMSTWIETYEKDFEEYVVCYKLNSAGVEYFVNQNLSVLTGEKFK